jgi:hypothetical protein
MQEITLLDAHSTMLTEDAAERPTDNGRPVWTVQSWRAARDVPVQCESDDVRPRRSEVVIAIVAVLLLVLVVPGSTAVHAVGCVVLANGTTVPLTGAGRALNVYGVASFSRSGLVHIADPDVTVDVPGGLSLTSHVLATMQTTTSADIAVKSAIPTTSKGRITITLTAPAPPGGVDVAWFVFG